MTYYELWLDAVEKLDHNEITLGEYEKLIMPLHREVDTLDRIRAEILVLDDADYDFEGYYKAVTDALAIIDKYRGDIK